MSDCCDNGLSAAVSSVLKEHRTLSINWIGPSDRNTSTGKYTQFCPKNQSKFPQKDIHRWRYKTSLISVKTELKIHTQLHSQKLSQPVFTVPVTLVLLYWSSFRLLMCVLLKNRLTETHDIRFNTTATWMFLGINSSNLWKSTGGMNTILLKDIPSFSVWWWWWWRALSDMIWWLWRPWFTSFSFSSDQSGKHCSQE